MVRILLVSQLVVAQQPVYTAMTYRVRSVESAGSGAFLAFHAAGLRIRPLYMCAVGCREAADACGVPCRLSLSRLFIYLLTYFSEIRSQA